MKRRGKKRNIIKRARRAELRARRAEWAAECALKALKEARPSPMLQIARAVAAHAGIFGPLAVCLVAWLAAVEWSAKWGDRQT